MTSAPAGTDAGPGGATGRRILFLGFTIPDETLRALGPTAAAAVTQTHNFAWSLVNALREGGCDVRLLSTLPVRDYPGYPRLVIRGGRFDDPVTGAGRLIGFVNFKGVKHVSRLLGCLRHGSSAARSNDAEVVLVHGVHLPFLWFARLARRRLGLRSVIVLTDPPGVEQPDDGRLLRLLRGLDRRLVRRALRHVDGAICLTRALGADFAPAARHLVMEGIVNPRLTSPPACHPSGGPARTGQGFTVAYAGALKVAYGVQRLVEAVLAVPEDVSVDVYGTGPLESWLRQRAAEDGRVRFHGPLPHPELLAALSRADLLVNPRPTDQDFVRYSFPSKLIEYMALDRPVLTTRLAGIPDEYSDKVLFADDDSTRGLATALSRAVRMPEAQRRALAAAARAFVLAEKDAGSQGRRIAAFLDQLTGPARVTGERATPVR
jgi:glycosyltransferase involved in cell wall biosynthesis